MPYLDFHGEGVEFIICAQVAKHIEKVGAKLEGAGLEEIQGGYTTVPAAARPTTSRQPARPGGSRHRGGTLQHRGSRQQRRGAPATNAEPLPGKPYGFVALPEEVNTWKLGFEHTDGRGEIRVVGHQQGTVEAVLVRFINRLSNGMCGWRGSTTRRRGRRRASERWRRAAPARGSRAVGPAARAGRAGDLTRLEA